MNKLLLALLLGLLLVSSLAFKIRQTGEDAATEETTEEGGEATEETTEEGGETTEEGGETTEETTEEGGETTEEGGEATEEGGEQTQECVCPDSKSNGSKSGIAQYVCGESDKIHEAWTGARSQVWYVGGPQEEVISKPLQAAIDEGADDALSFCIAFVAGVSTGWDTCRVINHIVQLGIDMGKETSEVEGWVEDGVQKRYSWYGGYEFL